MREHAFNDGKSSQSSSTILSKSSGGNTRVLLGSFACHLLENAGNKTERTTVVLPTQKSFECVQSVLSAHWQAVGTRMMPEMTTNLHY